MEKGFELFSNLGIGGMGTRGFGKIEVLKENWKEKDFWEGIKKFGEEFERWILGAISSNKYQTI